MRLSLRAITLILLLLAAAATASADTVSLTIINGGSNVSGGVYVGPYNFTSGGQSLQLVCDTFEYDVDPPETWTANTTTLSNLSGTIFGSTTSPLYSASNATQYAEVAWLVQQMFLPANASNPSTVAAIQWAIWDIFDSGAPNCTTGVSNCDPYAGGAAVDTNASTWIGLAQSNYAGGNYSNVVIYTPASGWPSGDGTPQEYIGLISTPEPGSLLLLGTGLIGLFAFRRRLSY